MCDRVYSEAIYTEIEPKPHNFFQFILNIFISQVQIWLLLIELMKVAHVSGTFKLPGTDNILGIAINGLLKYSIRLINTNGIPQGILRGYVFRHFHLSDFIIPNCSV